MIDKFREKDILKLSQITHIPVPDLTQLSAMGLLDKAATLNALILYDWKRLKSCRKYSTTQIVSALQKEYQISKSRVHLAIYQKKKNTHYCPECGKRTTKGELVRNNGLCDKCVSNSISL